MLRLTVFATVSQSVYCSPVLSFYTLTTFLIYIQFFFFVRVQEFRSFLKTRLKFHLEY